jgi:hypothetical protein
MVAAIGKSFYKWYSQYGRVVRGVGSLRREPHYKEDCKKEKDPRM